MDHGRDPMLENKILTTDSFGKAEMEHTFELGVRII